MVTATDLKTGKTFEMDGNPFQVIKYTHQKIGRGGANVKLTLRNLKTGASVEKTYNATAKFEEINTTKKPLQFLYKMGDSAVFMDNNTFDQVEISLDVIGEQAKFLNEGNEVDVLFWEGNALSVDLPPKVNLEVTETTPGVKGDTSSNVYKPATLGNGVQVKVPLFIKKGDFVRVDTRSGEYVERVKE